MKKLTQIISMLSKFSFILITVVIFSISYFYQSPLAYSETLQIAVLPFDINAEQNLDFLKKGIQDMLASRLSFKDQVRVIDKESVQKAVEGIKGFSGESFALLVGGELKADFVIYGSVTVIGNGTSIDSKLVDISGKSAPISFFKQINELGGVIPAINQFATTINETVFNRFGATAATEPQQSIQSNVNIVATAPSSSLSQPASPAHAGQQKLNSNFVIRPSASQSNGQLQNTDSAKSPNPEFSVTNSVRGGTGTWQSPIFKHLITGIAVGDTDKDNIMETVFISDSSVYIYRFSGNQFVKVTETPKNRLLTYIAVGVGDINNNGVEEIFVSTLNADKNMPSSFVIEYNGSQYVEIVKNNPWYFSIIDTKSEGKILLGQKQRSGKYNIYDSPIYKMVWDGERYVQSEQILEAGKANVLGAMFDDISGDSNPMVVAYDDAEHLTVFSNNGGSIWRDLNRTGGNMNYFKLPKETPKDDDEFEYFPCSVRSADINGDGNIEILYASNSDITGGYLSKFKRYSKGVINCSFWNNTGLTLQWSTPEQTGRVSDFIISDFDNDGSKELVIANVIKDSISTFSDSESVITAYELMQ
ncbi:MAG: VCBS repeat-containing protein [Desulfamplus sp.]|nr:VCBS repeat-containing protein [Desulfamplus sp.]